MRYFVINASNGYCGCDDSWVTRTENDDWKPDGDYILDSYVYADGAAGLDPYSDYNDYDEYAQDIYDYSTWEEITEEEFNQLINEEGLEER